MELVLRIHEHRVVNFALQGRELQFLDENLRRLHEINAVVAMALYTYLFGGQIDNLATVDVRHAFLSTEENALKDNLHYFERLGVS